MDQKISFNDQQLSRTYFILSKTNDYRMIKERDRLFSMISLNIMNGKFDFRKGNNLVSLVEAMLVNFENLFFSSKEPLYDMISGNKFFTPPTEIVFGGTYMHANEIYMRYIKIMEKMLPFFQYFFEKQHYSLNKKLLVLTLMKQIKMYDEQLFTNFIKSFKEAIVKEKVND